jgi:hypothetical protein
MIIPNIMYIMYIINIMKMMNTMNMMNIIFAFVFSLFNHASTLVLIQLDGSEIAPDSIDPWEYSFEKLSEGSPACRLYAPANTPINSNT